MKKYIVYYYDNAADLNHVWVQAENKDEAISQVQDEYWDIDKIIDVVEE